MCISRTHIYIFAYKISYLLSTPSGSLVFVQTCPGKAMHIEQNAFEKALQECGYFLEASRLKEGTAQMRNDIDVYLQQAKSFYNKKRATLLVGDAAATASFFEGMGANTSFKTCAYAGEFFKQFQKDPEMAYDVFNHNMKNATDELIARSSYLFDQKSSL